MRGIALAIATLMRDSWTPQGPLLLGWLALAACSAAGEGKAEFGPTLGAAGHGGGAGQAMVGPPAQTGGNAGSLSLGPLGGGTSSEPMACAAESNEAHPTPTDILVLLDQSGSMTLDGNRWEPTATSLKAFVRNPMFNGLGVGLKYFPLGASMREDPAICQAGNYVKPGVPIAPLPDNTSALVASLDAHHFTSAEGELPAHWGTPTLPAVQGALQYLASYGAANPERKLYLLLATDGQPSNLCTGNNVDGIAMALTAAAAQTPPIQTFIIGIGEVARLNVLATAGGTGHPAFIVDAGGTATQAQFTAALEAIRHTALPCEYEIPTPMSGRLDPGEVNVELTTSSATVVFPMVTDASACTAGESNWYYDNPTAPQRVIMCPAACETLKAGNGRIDLLFGCKTVTK